MLEKETPSLSFSTETTTSWMREAGMDADIRFYAKGSLLRRSEYFFRIWYYAKQLFQQMVAAIFVKQAIPEPDSTLISPPHYYFST